MLQQQNDPFAGLLNSKGLSTDPIAQSQGAAQTVTSGIGSFGQAMAQPVLDAAHYADALTRGQENWDTTKALGVGANAAMAMWPFGIGRRAAMVAAEELPRIANPETIRSAAHTLNGKIYEGAIHSDAMQELMKDTGLSFDDAYNAVIAEAERQGEPIAGGFVTNKGRYLSRREAQALTGKSESSEAIGRKLGDNSAMAKQLMQ